MFLKSFSILNITTPIGLDNLLKLIKSYPDLEYLQLVSEIYVGPAFISEFVVEKVNLLEHPKMSRTTAELVLWLHSSDGYIIFNSTKTCFLKSTKFYYSQYGDTWGLRTFCLRSSLNKSIL